MTERPRTDPIVVIGGGLAGMAAAARLAKLGHQVELFELAPVLGGRWAPYGLDTTGVLVDDAPSVLGFPAPWRDLFRKSGRPLEAELARIGFALVPAQPLMVSFADGSELRFPTDRGEQYAVLSATYGTAVAERWRALVDRLDDVWQAMRPLGLEAELPKRRLTQAEKTRLLSRKTVADLAESIRHPHLAALIRSVAHRNGSIPEQTPALVAVDLSLTRTFGRWQLQSSADGAADTGRSSVLAEVLAARLATRDVVVHLDTPVSDITVHQGRAIAVQTEGLERPARAVVNTVHPWALTTELRKTIGRPRRLRSAYAPVITHQLTPGSLDGVEERIELSATGVPRMVYRRGVGDDILTTFHDFHAENREDPFGIQWRGFRSWPRRPFTYHRWEGLYQAGSFSPAGRGTSQMLLAGALASGAAHDAL